MKRTHKNFAMMEANLAREALVPRLVQSDVTETDLVFS